MNATVGATIRMIVIGIMNTVGIEAIDAMIRSMMMGIIKIAVIVPIVFLFCCCTDITDREATCRTMMIGIVKIAVIVTPYFLF